MLVACVARRLVLLGVAVGAAALAGCGPDFTLECAGGAPVIDGAPFSCDRCFEVLECEGGGDGVAECPTGITGSCSADVEAREYCCEGDCITCP